MLLKDTLRCEAVKECGRRPSNHKVGQAVPPVDFHFIESTGQTACPTIASPAPGKGSANFKHLAEGPATHGDKDFCCNVPRAFPPALTCFGSILLQVLSPRVHRSPERTSVEMQARKAEF